MGEIGPSGKGLRVRTYAVYSDSDTVVDKAASLFKSNYKVDNRLILVRSDLLTTEIARRLGLFDGDQPPDGVVLKLNDSSAGYYRSDLWDWLD